jgi:cytochrome c-type protein NapB
MIMKYYFPTLLFVAAASLALQAVGAEVSSLRGAVELGEDAQAPEQKMFPKDGEPISRDYVQQPPLIPHKIDNYQVNRKVNKCLSCHSWKNYREAGATKISQTHFEDREANVLANVSARRYFCTQCHVPQANAEPLVENTFEPVTAISGE